MIPEKFTDGLGLVWVRECSDRDRPTCLVLLILMTYWQRAAACCFHISLSAGSITDCIETSGSETIWVKMYFQQHTNSSDSEGCCSLVLSVWSAPRCVCVCLSKRDAGCSSEAGKSAKKFCMLSDSVRKTHTHTHTHNTVWVRRTATVCHCHLTFVAAAGKDSFCLWFGRHVPKSPVFLN